VVDIWQTGKLGLALEVSFEEILGRLRLFRLGRS
jgi:hypothetical protein